MLIMICSKRLPLKEGKLPVDLLRKVAKLRRKLVGKVELLVVLHLKFVV